jgi:asparagine synthase (glutamine-hydrolysing)
MLRTTFESESEHQPWTLGDLSIAADARIDARADLLASLADHGHSNIGDRPDAELILRAYRVWGDTCVRSPAWRFRLRDLGCDPAASVLRPRSHRMKPFFYARVGSHLVFSNTLTCLRLHPAVSTRLNDEAIADFLVAGYLQDIGTTSFGGHSAAAARACARRLGERRPDATVLDPADRHRRSGIDVRTTTSSAFRR